MNLDRNSTWLSAFVVLLIALGGLYSGRAVPPEVTQAASDPRPNVIIVTLDTLNASRLSCYGNPYPLTPNLDAFAARSARFETAVTNSVVTAPSHASVLTGLTPLEHGVLRNGLESLSAENVTLAEVLSGEGYATAAFVSGFPLHSKFGLAQGFDRYDDHFAEQQRFDGKVMPAKKYYGRAPYYRFDRYADETTDLVLDWVDDGASKPFMLWVHYYDAHWPYRPHPELAPPESHYRDLAPGFECGRNCQLLDKLELALGSRSPETALRRYDGEVAFLDRELGRLFDALDGKGILDQSIVVITADHGESLIEHDYFFDHGDHLFEPSLRVPLMIHLPQRSSGVVVENVLAQNVDVTPTILDFLGIPAPRPLDGRSLLGAIRGEPTPPVVSIALSNAPSFGVRKGIFSTEVTGPLVSARSIDLKLIRTPGVGDVLYDLTVDPGEQRELSPDTGEEGRELRRALHQHTNTSRAEFTSVAPTEEDALRLRALGYVE